MGLSDDSKMDVIPLTQADYSAEDVAEDTVNKLAYELVDTTA